MSAPSERTQTTSAAHRLDALAFGILAFVPLGTAIINRSSLALIVIAALVALGARAASGEFELVIRRLALLLRHPLAWICGLFLAYGALSIGWSHHLKPSLSTYGEFVLAIGAVLALHVSLPRQVPNWALKLAAISFALGCLSMTAEVSTGMAIRTELGSRNIFFIFKRSVTAFLVMFWPIAAFLWFSGKRPVAVALLILLGIAIYFAQSSAALMGLAVGLAFVALAAMAGRLASRIAAICLVAAMLVAPFLGTITMSILPAAMVERLHFAHADQRIDAWLSFGEVVKLRPIGGAGFGTSSRMAQDPVAKEVPEDRRQALNAWHPHNGYLQIWAETGLIGAFLAGAILALTALGTGRLRSPRNVIALGIVASAAAIMLVGHGIWQGWWSAVLGVAALWTARLPLTDVRPAGGRR